MAPRPRAPRRRARRSSRALEEPIRQLADSAGLEGSVVVDKIHSLEKGHGLSVESGAYEDPFKGGIIDPTLVTRSALQNTASIAKHIITTEASRRGAAREAEGRCGRARRYARHDVVTRSPSATAS
jgi:chaperonin GroEL (HSP60 family)